MNSTLTFLLDLNDLELFSQIPWQSVESVGDQSPYVSTVAVHIRNTVPLLRENLSPARKYFINFCHKFAK